MKYQVFEDTSSENIGTLVFESNNFIEALKQARKIAIQKVNRVFVYYNPVNTDNYSDMCIAYDPMGRFINFGG